VFDSFKDWLPAIGVVMAALISGVAVTLGNVLLRRTAKDQLVANVNLNTQTAEVNAKDLHLRDEELETKKHVWASEMAQQIGSAAHILLVDAEARVTSALGEVAAFKADLAEMRAELAAVRVSLADCEQRCAAHETRSAQIMLWAQSQGWEAP
jgi:hypothetical protein